MTDLALTGLSFSPNRSASGAILRAACRLQVPGQRTGLWILFPTACPVATSRGAALDR